MLLTLLVLVVLAFLSVHCSPRAGLADSQYFVSASSGCDDPAVPGSETQPWRSLPYAISRLREIRNWQSPAGPNNTASIVMRAGTYYLQDRVRLDSRDSYLTITSQGEDVKLSGGRVLDVAWHQEGDILHGEYEGECGELYYGDYRMMKARSPNIAQPGVNKHFATGPFHTVAGFLVENENCQVESDKFSQPNCPWENRNGFYLKDEMSPDWEDLNQTLVLVYHSWINEYARVANVSEEEGRHKVMFQEPLGHAPIGEWIASGDLRYLVLNNRAVLDSPGEYVCTQAGETARVSWIPPAGAGSGPTFNPVMTNLDILLQMIKVQSVNIEGLRLQETTYTGLDRSMDWSNTALDIRGSAGGTDYSNRAVSNLSLLRHQHSQLSSFSNSNDRNYCLPQLQCSYRQECPYRYWYSDLPSLTRSRSLLHLYEGYHGILTLGGMEYENITITNNYIDGTGITRYWGSGSIFADGSRNVLISNNEMTRSMGGALMIKSESLGKDYWSGQENQDYLVNVEYNYIHDFGVGIISDFGGIKTGSKAMNCDGKSEEGLEQSCYTYIRFISDEPLEIPRRQYNISASFDVYLSGFTTI